MTFVSGPERIALRLSQGARKKPKQSARGININELLTHATPGSSLKCQTLCPADMSNLGLGLSGAKTPQRPPQQFERKWPRAAETEIETAMPKPVALLDAVSLGRDDSDDNAQLTQKRASCHY